MRTLTTALAAAVYLSAAATASFGQIQIGQTAPDFSKPELVGTSAGPQHTLYQHASQPVVVLFLLGND